MSADPCDSHGEGSDDSDASDGDEAEWDPQPGDPPPLAQGVTKLAEGTLNADVKEVYSRLLADEVSLCIILMLLNHLPASNARRNKNQSAQHSPFTSRQVQVKKHVTTTGHRLYHRCPGAL